jgi:hypothetical protein
MFGVNGTLYTYPRGVNGGYLVTGYTVPASVQETYHGFVGLPNSLLLTTFDAPGSIATQALGMNSVGAIVGCYDSNSVRHGFVRDPLGKIVSFDAAGSTRTEAWAINDAGAIVGNYLSNGAWRGFRRDPLGVITSIAPPGCTEVTLSGINDEGVITGSCFDIGFVFTP